MFIVNKDSVRAARRKLEDPELTQEALDDVRRMLEIKQAILWRADMGVCCGAVDDIAACLAYETAILENTVTAIEKGDVAEAVSLLDEYEHTLEATNEPSQPKYC